MFCILEHLRQPAQKNASAATLRNNLAPESRDCKVNMVLNVHRNHKAYQGRGERGEGWGEGGMEVRGRGRLYTYRYTVTTRMFFWIMMGSDEIHFNVSVGSDGQSHKTVHKPQPF